MDLHVNHLRRAIELLCAVVLTAGGYLVSSRLQRIWWPVWLAPLPVLLLATRLRALQAASTRLLSLVLMASLVSSIANAQSPSGDHGGSGRADKGELSATESVTDAEYRKFEKVESFIRARNARDYAISTPNGIDEGSYVSIGGIEQWVTIRGEDRSNPVLLFLHGGPGDVTNPWSFAFFAPWEKYFTVVQWDQRGAGRTLRKTGPEVASTMKVDRMTKDGIELTEYLRKYLHKDKIFVVAHSFGTILGLGMVRAKPELFYAYVGTGQVADELKNYSVAYDALLQKAQAIGNQEAIDELKRVGPPPYANGEGYGAQRKWSNRFEGSYEFLYGTIGLASVAPGVTLQDINDDFDGQILADVLVSQTRSMGPAELGLEFSLPMFVFEGDEDFTTPTALARQYVASMKAPRKEFVLFPGGHFAMFTHSDEFLRELVKRVRPLAVH
jgi:pimeloyl-ACP methyl ester carboxylesterase